MSFSWEKTHILFEELCSNSCLWIKMIWVLQNWQTIVCHLRHHCKAYYCSLAADIYSIPICSYEYSYMQFAFDSYGRKEIEDILIADSNFYNILNLLSAKQCRDLLLSRQCKVFINCFVYERGTNPFLTSYANPNLVSSHWGYYLDLQWYTEKYGSF